MENDFQGNEPKLNNSSLETMTPKTSSFKNSFQTNEFVDLYELLPKLENNVQSPPDDDYLNSPTTSTSQRSKLTSTELSQTSDIVSNSVSIKLESDFETVVSLQNNFNSRGAYSGNESDSDYDIPDLSKLKYEVEDCDSSTDNSYCSNNFSNASTSRIVSSSCTEASLVLNNNSESGPSRGDSNSRNFCSATIDGQSASQSMESMPEEMPSCSTSGE